MHLAPEPGVHAAHRRAEDQPQVIDVETFDEQAPLRLDHVAVAVAGKPALRPSLGLLERP